MNRRALNRALLARQLLLERSTHSPLELLRRLAGLQSQHPRSAYFALRARLESFSPADLSKLLVERKAVRLALMRSTVHLVASDDALWLRPTLQTDLHRQFAATPSGKAAAQVDAAAIAKLGRNLVEAEPQTPESLAEALRSKWPRADVKALALAVRTHVPLVQVPPRGLWGLPGQPFATSLEHWLDAPLAEPNLEQLVLRYLRAFGPATVQDAQVWSGVRSLSATFKKLRSSLEVFRSEGGDELFDLPDAPRPPEDTPAPARLLGEFEQPLLAYADRTRLMDPAHKAQLFTVNGIIRAPVLLDGFVAGRWQLDADGHVALTLFEKLKKKSVLDEEIARVEAFARS